MAQECNSTINYTSLTVEYEVCDCCICIWSLMNVIEMHYKWEVTLGIFKSKIQLTYSVFPTNIHISHERLEKDISAYKFWHGFYLASLQPVCYSPMLDFSICLLFLSPSALGWWTVFSAGWSVTCAAYVTVYLSVYSEPILTHSINLSYNWSTPTCLRDFHVRLWAPGVSVPKWVLLCHFAAWFERVFTG